MKDCTKSCEEWIIAKPGRYSIFKNCKTQKIKYDQAMYLNLDHIYFLKKWFRVDIKPFKTAFLNAIKRWSMTFKKHLLERVVNNLADLNSFIERADEGLMQQVKEGDYENLINVMGILRVKSLLLIINIIFNPKNNFS